MEGAGEGLTVPEEQVVGDELALVLSEEEIEPVVQEVVDPESEVLTDVEGERLGVPE